MAGRAAVKFEEGEGIAQMVSPRRPPGGGWVYDPARVFRRSKAQVPPDIQRELERRARDLIEAPPYPASSPEGAIQLLGGHLLKMARSLLLLLLQVPFARPQRPFGFIRIEVCQTSVRREWAV